MNNQYEYATTRKQYARRKAEFISELPDNCFDIEEYNGFQLNRYYWDPENKRLIMKTRGKYKIVNPTKTNGLYTVVLCDINNQPHTTSYKKLYHELIQLK